MARWPKQDFTSWLAPRSGRWPDVRASVRSESWIVQPPGADSPLGSKWNLKSNDVDSGKPVSPMVNFLADSGERSEPRVARWSRQCLLNSAPCSLHAPELSPPLVVVASAWGSGALDAGPSGLVSWESASELAAQLRHVQEAPSTRTE